MGKTRKIISVLLLIIIITGLFTGCSANTRQFQSEEDFQKANIGILTGSSFDLLAKKQFPDAKKVYFSNITDLILNLKQAKINGILMDKGAFTPLQWEDSGLSYVELDMPATEYAVAFPGTAGSEALQAQINDFIRTQSENGTLAKLEEKWFSDIEPDCSLDFARLTGENGTLRVAVTAENKPFDYLRNGHFCGYDADFIYRFAQEYGYGLDIDTMDFGALLPGLSSGRYDLAISSITVTEEWQESVLFSDVYCSSSIVMAILADRQAADKEPTLADFSTAHIGILTGSAHDQTVKNVFPDATPVYFATMTDMILAVEYGIIDCYIEDAPFLTMANWKDANLKRVDGTLAQMENGFVFPQEGDPKLREQINDFISEAKADGTIDRLHQKWLGSTEPSEYPDYESLTGKNGTIHMAISVDNMPMLYHKDGHFTGFEMELLTMFAQQHGYDFRIDVVSFGSIIAGISAGRYDMGASSLNITAEREENVNFSIPYGTYDAVLVIKDGERAVSRSLSDLEHATIGIVTGTVWEDITQREFPNAKRKYYNSDTDALLALQHGKVDAFLADNTTTATLLRENSGITCIGDSIDPVSTVLVFPKESYDEKLFAQINAFIAMSKDNGTLKALREKWHGDKEPTVHPDYTKLTGENGTLKIAISDSQQPFTYRKGQLYTGYEVDFLTLFAEEYGYQLEMQPMTPNSLIPAVGGGEFDIGASGIAETAELTELVTISDPHHERFGVAVIRNEATRPLTFWEEIKEDFLKTFIREDRWKLIVSGLDVTVEISLWSILTGTLFGFGLYMLSRSRIRLVQAITKGFTRIHSRIIAGTPLVVILMILFYVVFGRVRNVSGSVVAIICFTLSFGSFVYDHMTLSVDSIDPGQAEAAYALGYTKNKTLFRIIFPQAMNFFTPSYCGQVVELIKGTAVVGYIAVNDLTTMGDIIRSNTYEAFFPLIATAVIYFLLTWIVSLLLGFVKMQFEPKRRSKEDILKGVIFE